MYHAYSGIFNPPLKNCYFRNFGMYFDQKTIIIKRDLKVYAACYSKFETCPWITSWTLLYITVHVFEYISWMLSYELRLKLNQKCIQEMHISDLLIFGWRWLCLIRISSEKLNFTNIKCTKMWKLWLPSCSYTPPNSIIFWSIVFKVSFLDSIIISYF